MRISRRRRARGFNLIELLVVLAVTVILLSTGLTAVNTMLITNKSRNLAESIVAGLQLARAEAIRRNAPMRFHLLSTITSSCAPSATGQFWAVTQTDQASRGIVTGYCESSPFTPPDQPDPCNPDAGICSGGTPAANCRPAGNPPACANDPWIAYKSPRANPTGDLTVAGSTANGSGASAAVITFGPIGQVLANFDGAATLGFVQVAPTSNTDAKTWGVRINTTNGSVKLCDPAKTLTAPTDPYAC